MYFEMQNMVIWNNHEYGVLMNCKVKCVENQGKNNEWYMWSVNLLLQYCGIIL